MKSLKKLVLLVASLTMAVSMMTVSASAAADNQKSVANAATVKKFADADVTVSGDFTYNGKEQTATVTVKGLTEGKDYTVSGNKGTNSGEYTVTITGINDYKGTVITKTFTIKAAPEKKATVKTGTTKKAVKATSYKKKAKTTSFKFTSANKGQLQVKLSGGNKKTRKKIKVVRKGKKIKVVMPKGTKKGTYKIKVRVKAYNQYKKTAWKTFKIVVK